jgi:hypothetical protein
VGSAAAAFSDTALAMSSAQKPARRIKALDFWSRQLRVTRHWFDADTRFTHEAPCCGGLPPIDQDLVAVKLRLFLAAGEGIASARL